MQKHVNLVDLVKSFPTSIFLAKFGFDTADNKPDKTAPKDLIFTYVPRPAEFEGLGFAMITETERLRLGKSHSPLIPGLEYRRKGVSLSTKVDGNAALAAEKQSSLGCCRYPAWPEGS